MNCLDQTCLHNEVTLVVKEEFCVESIDQCDMPIIELDYNDFFLYHDFTCALNENIDFIHDFKLEGTNIINDFLDNLNEPFLSHEEEIVDEFLENIENEYSFLEHDDLEIDFFEPHLETFVEDCFESLPFLSNLLPNYFHHASSFFKICENAMDFSCENGLNNLFEIDSPFFSLEDEKHKSCFQIGENV